MEKKKTHNMLFQLLDPKFKNLRLVSSFIGWKQIVFMVKDYDRWSLFQMLLKGYHVVHPIWNCYKLAKWWMFLSWHFWDDS
jgi:hypothetical protein